MKNLLIRALVVLGFLVFADQKSFVQAYDTGKFDEAAKQVEGLDITDSGVARRLGVMYYKAMGVKEDQAKGRALLEKAMMAGDATAAVNLAKIYFKVEKNSPKAAWCLMVAEGLKDTSVKDDVVKLRGYFGDDYIKEVTSYIAQLRDLLSSEQAALENKTTEADRERTSLTRQITLCQEESKKKDEAFAREREGLMSAKDDLEEKLAAAEEAMAADKKSLEEFRAKHAQDIADRSARDKIIEKLKRDHAEAAAKARKVGESLAGYKKIVQAMEVGALEKDGDVEEISYKEIFARYNQLVARYNLLVRKYNNLLRVSQNATLGSAGK